VQCHIELECPPEENRGNVVPLLTGTLVNVESLGKSTTDPPKKREHLIPMQCYRRRCSQAEIFLDGKNDNRMVGNGSCPSILCTVPATTSR